MSGSFPATKWIWRNGEYIAWESATTHVMTHAIHYGTSVFEGIRCYRTATGPAVFRLPEHVRRLRESARVYRMEPPFEQEELERACVETVLRNELEECYIRPFVFRGVGAPGLNPAASPIETFVVCWPWGEYLGAGALAEGVDAGVSSWQRPAPNTMPVLAKAGGHYLNSQLITMEAKANGFAEGIGLGPGGLVSEGAGQNIFLVRKGELVTPPVDGTLLAGITRDCIMTIAADAGIRVREEAIPREMLYLADELFFTGTAAEVTPIRSVDRIPIGAGSAGPVTRQLQERFLNLVRGAEPDRHGWLTPVRPARAGSVVGA